MDRFEILVKTYLENLGRGVVIYEPNGRYTFPDFSVGETLAVEATRLVKPIGSSSLEADFKPAIQTLRNAVDRVKDEGNSSTRFVNFECHFPLDARTAANELKRFLASIVNDPNWAGDDIVITDDLKIDLVQGTFRAKIPFVTGMITSPELSGWVVSDLLEQSEFALAKKERHLQKANARYSGFWLAVGSHLTNALNEFSFRDFEREIRVTTGFDRLVLIDETNLVSSRAIDLTD